MKDDRLDLKVLEDYYNRTDIEEWLLVDNDNPFISIVFSDGADILPYSMYLRHQKLMKII